MEKHPAYLGPIAQHFSRKLSSFVGFYDRVPEMEIGSAARSPTGLLHPRWLRGRPGPSWGYVMAQLIVSRDGMLSSSLQHVDDDKVDTFFRTLATCLLLSVLFGTWRLAVKRLDFLSWSG